ncbi:MAG: PIN domain-containing protein [Candidatus Aegiribacteria sp.]|nr:PIN domain-containing protein [Candidatus Aegiribacteria sp.]
MRIVVDTNVLISAVFFGGKPGFILDAWRDRKLEFIITEETLAEYVAVLHRFGIRYPGVNSTDS